MERHDATGILLAGGRSKRFGSDKLLAPFGDSTLGRRVVDAMAPCVSRLILSVAPSDGLQPTDETQSPGEPGRADSFGAFPGSSGSSGSADSDDQEAVARTARQLEEWFPEVDVITDAEEDIGPLAGLMAGLEATRTRAAFVAACDYPFLTPHAVDLLLTALDEMDAALPDIGGRLHPLCGAYSTQVLPLVDRFISSRGRRATEFARSLDVRILRSSDLPGVDTARVFENINTPAELRRAEDRV